MSTLKVNAITDASGGNTATINSMTPTADSLQGFRNRIINGDMGIDQRNAGASVTPTDGNYLVDRFYVRMNQASKFTAQQNSGSVTPPVGFTNYQGIVSSSAYAVLSGDYFRLVQSIEGLNCSDLAWGTASAKTVTLSFWVRSSLTGTFGGALLNSALNRSYVFSYTISAANTWEQKTVTIVGDTSGTWLTTNGVGISVSFSLGAGTTYSSTAGSWSGSLYFAPTGATSVVGTNGATFYITGVQLEVGSVATPFERRDYGRELIMCQRYYYKVFPGAAGIILSTGWGASTTTNLKAAGAFAVTMRTRPTALEQNGTANNYQVVVAGTATTCSSVPTYDGATGADYWIVNGIVASGLTAGQAGYLRTDATNGATAYLAWSAEL